MTEYLSSDFLSSYNSSNFLLSALCISLLVHILNEKNLFHTIKIFLESVFTSIPTIEIDLTTPIATAQDVSSIPKSAPSLLDPLSPHLIQCYNPCTLQLLGTEKSMNADDVHARCARAAAAQKIWSTTTYRQRRTLLRTIQRAILDNMSSILSLCSLDSGKTPLDALLGEVLTTCEKIRTLNANGELWLSKSYRATGPIMIHKTAYVEYVPLGVLGVIAPWNYPFHNMLNHILSGLFSGNAVVTKVSEHTSWSAKHFSSLVRKALLAHGHSPDLVQVVTGFGDVGAALVECPLIDKVIFTGSPKIGRLVMEKAAKSLKPVILELGGKDPMVICDDVLLEDVLPWAMRGCFQNAGQNCCGVERLFVYESIHDKFVEAIKNKIIALRQGPVLSGNVDCGAMVMQAQITYLQELVDDAVSKGARLHCGGAPSKKHSGQFYEPTLLTNLSSNMRIWKEEVFGPIMCVICVPKDSDAQCVQMINDCSFGLGSSVYAKHQSRALAIGEKIRSGMFTANDFGVNYLIQSLPFGGVNESGFDRFAGPEGLRACCLERSIVLDRIPGVRTTIPKPLGYPVDSKRSIGFGTSLIHLFYDNSILGKIRAIWGLIKYG